jgi:hypothetical protein
MAVDISRFPSNLNYQSFKAQYLTALQNMNPPGTPSESEMNGLWSVYNAKEPGDKKPGTMSNIVSTTTGIASKIVSTQESQGYMQDTKFSSSGMLDAISKSAEKGGALQVIFDTISSTADLFTDSLKEQTELFHMMNVDAGMVGTMSEDFRQELTKAAPELKRIGIDFSELAGASKKLIENTGRFVNLNRDSWLQAGKAASAYVGTLSEMVDMFPSFEKVGYGAGDVAEIIEESGKRTINLGLQSKGVIKDIGSNLGKVNEYGFKNGIQGLAEMARKSKEFRMEMNEVFKVAESVMDPDKAIAMSAELQAIGGAIGDFNDPLKLMYMATNDAEGLQEAMIGVAGSLATYNEEQGRFEITGANLRKARALAQEMGMDYNTLASSAIAAAEKSSAASAMLASGLTLDDDQKRFLTNISQMKGGQMTIELNSDRIRDALGLDKNTKEIALENLTQAQAETLLKYQDELKQKTTDDIIKGQATSIEQMNRDVNFIAQLLKNEFSSSARVVSQRLDLEKKVTDFSTNVANKAANEIPNKGVEIVNKALDVVESLTKDTKAKTEPIKPTTVDNSTQTNQQNNTQQTNTTPQKSEVTLTVKTDEPMMDEFTRYVYRRPDLISGLTNETPGSYTQNK